MKTNLLVLTITLTLSFGFTTLAHANVLTPVTSDSLYGTSRGNNYYYQNSYAHAYYGVQQREQIIASLYAQIEILREQLRELQYAQAGYYRYTNYHYDTNINYRDSQPDVTTKTVRNVKNTSADLRGNVDMNDFENGRVFFVYGKSKSQVRDIENDYSTYNDIEENSDNLQKESVDTNLDTQDDYDRTVRNLDDNSDYYARLCVQYEDYNNDDVLLCGATESFSTD